MIILSTIYIKNFRIDASPDTLVAKNDKELQKGLMFRKDRLENNEGMLFPMTYKINSMWMKNTSLELNIAFIAASAPLNKPISSESNCLDS